MISIKRLAKSFFYAFRGLLKVIKEEQNFKIELLVAIIAIILAYYSNFNYLEYAILFLAIGMVLLMEVINSAIELISDILKPKIDQYIKEIKDIVATAVLIAASSAILVGLMLFGHHWWNIL